MESFSRSTIAWGNEMQDGNNGGGVAVFVKGRGRPAPGVRQSDGVGRKLGAPYGRCCAKSRAMGVRECI